MLHEQVHRYPDAVDLTHVNILAELYMEASEWKLAVDVIQHARHALCAQNDLPVELQASEDDLACRGVSLYDAACVAKSSTA